MKATVANISDILISAFPEIEQDIAEYSNLAHLQLMEMRVFVENELIAGNAEPARRCVALVDSLLASCDREVGNAIHVSFLENVDPHTEIGKTIFGMFTPRLRDAWNAINQYMVQLSVGERRH